MGYREYHTVNKDGDKITVRVNIDINGISIYDLVIKQKGKRKEVFISDLIHNDYTYRSLKISEDRYNYRMNLYLKYVDLDTLNNALIEVWQEIKPTELKI